MDLKNFLKVKSLRSPGWSSCDVGFCVCVFVCLCTQVSAWALHSQLHWFLHTPEGVSLQSAEQELTCCSVRSHWCLIHHVVKFDPGSHWHLYVQYCSYPLGAIFWGPSLTWKNLTALSSKLCFSLSAVGPPACGVAERQGTVHEMMGLKLSFNENEAKVLKKKKSCKCTRKYL